MPRARPYAPRSSVFGVTAPAPRSTLAGRFWLACALSAPVAFVLLIVEGLWRLLAG